MKLVYTNTQEEVEVGDIIDLGSDDEEENVRVEYFRPPHKPSSSGKVSVKYVDKDWTQEFYVSVIGAEWIEREDRSSVEAEDDEDYDTRCELHGREDCGSCC